MKASAEAAPGCGLQETNMGNCAYHVDAKKLILGFQYTDLFLNISASNLQSLESGAANTLREPGK